MLPFKSAAVEVSVVAKFSVSHMPVTPKCGGHAQEVQAWGK